MNIIYPFIESFRDIWSHKFRSALTILGVMLGASTLMTMFSITEGMAVGMRHQMEATGNMEKIIVRPASPPPEQEEIKEISPGITYKDVEVIKKASPWVAWVSPTIEENMPVVYQGKVDRTNIRGGEEGVLIQDKHVQPFGRFITEFDLRNQSRVCVLGSKVVNRLFSSPEECLGKTVEIKGVSFKVVGYFPRYWSLAQQRAVESGMAEAQAKRREERRGRKKGKTWGWDPFPWKNDMVVIPLTTMQAVFKSASVVKGVDQGPDKKLQNIHIGVTDISKLRDMMEQVRSAILFNHNGIEDFELWNELDRIKDVDEQIMAVRISGGLIAGIGLLVGGIGIMNIMLASIVDRIREIGIRRAIGAAPADIFIQVCFEAVFLAILGGILGLGVSYGMVYYLDEIVQIPNKPIIRPYAVALSLTFAIVTGILAGLYPAFKASALRPVEALKFD